MENQDKKKKRGAQTTSSQHLSGVTKAAIFLVSLGEEVASKIFKYLKEEEIEQLTFEIARLKTVTIEEKEQVLSEFYEMMMGQQFISSGGIDYAKSVLEKALGSQKAIDIINRLTSTLQVRPFDFIQKVDPAHLLSFLQQEHPQTIALVLSYLEPSKAGSVIAALETNVRTDVAKRIATMDRTSPDTLYEIERVIERKISSIMNENFTVAGGVDAIVEILNNVDRSTEKSIMEVLEEDDPELAEEVKKRMFVFEDIVVLDDRSVQRLLRDVEHQDLARALKAVDSSVQDKVYTNMSKRAAQSLREDIEFMGPLRIKEVEEAQQKIVAIIRKLEEQGEIVVARPGSEDFLV